MKKVLFILGQLDDQDIEWMIGAGRRQHLAAQELLIRQGETIGALYIVLSGEMAVTVNGASGERELNRLGAGEMVGEMSFIDARPPSATVRATAESLVFAIPKDRLAAKLAEDMAMAARFYKALAVFLSDRLRGTVSLLGYGGDGDLQEEVAYEDELDLTVLDNIHLAGERFERILRRFME